MVGVVNATPPGRCARHPAPSRFAFPAPAIARRAGAPVRTGCPASPVEPGGRKAIRHALTKIAVAREESIPVWLIDWIMYQ